MCDACLAAIRSLVRLTHLTHLVRPLWQFASTMIAPMSMMASAFAPVSVPVPHMAARSSAAKMAFIDTL